MDNAHPTIDENIRNVQETEILKNVMSKFYPFEV